MPFHSVIITNRDGMVLFSKYYDFRLSAFASEAKLFNDALCQNTQQYWKNATSKQAITFM